MNTTLNTLNSNAFGDNVVAFPLGHMRQVKTVSVVVPCYNEAKRLAPDLFISFLDQEPAVSLIFVDDGSRDATLDRLAEIHAAHPSRVHVLSLSRNSGKAEAVRQGLIHACATDAGFVGYWDADLATPLDAIADFARVGARYDDVTVIYGARRVLLGHRVQRTLGRRLVSRACATLARLAVRLPIGDTQCGAKLLRNTPDLAAALEAPFTAGWLFDVELFSRLSAKSANPHRAFYEFPLCEWTEVAGSNVSARAIVRSGLSMLRLIGETRFGLSPRVCTAPDVHANTIHAAVAPVAKAA